MNNALIDDIIEIQSTALDLEIFKSKNFLITGATGLIGYNLISILANISSQLNLGIKIYALVRNRDKAYKMFEGLLDQIEFVYGDVCNSIRINDTIDYIIHGASHTASIDFVERPVETIYTSLQGTLNVMDFAKDHNVQGVVYLSTMEVYGSPHDDKKINEEYSTNLNTMTVRSCYPESKRMCENIVASYGKEYDIPAKVVRLTQTFGPGVNYNDGRVFAEFARCVIEHRDIILHTKGLTKRSYLYTADAVAAILTVLVCGTNGEAYNVANEETYCSIYDMACTVAQTFGKGQINVIVENVPEDRYGYAPELHMNLDTSKIRKLGWKPTKDLKNMYATLIESMQLT
jgi:nucleoside-diphosphate-sugar epimerase